MITVESVEGEFSADSMSLRSNRDKEIDTTYVSSNDSEIRALKGMLAKHLKSMQANIKPLERV